MIAQPVQPVILPFAKVGLRRSADQRRHFLVIGVLYGPLAIKVLNYPLAN
jgi:hypothetical protein